LLSQDLAKSRLLLNAAVGFGWKRSEEVSALLKSLSWKRIELARIHLAYARAEIVGYEKSSEIIERALRHLQDADLLLASSGFGSRPAAHEALDPKGQAESASVEDKG
jgi:hypothetical protein